MRFALLAVFLLAGCPRPSDGECDEDPECDEGLVCARGDHLCVSPSEVRMTRTEWTVNGQDAGAGACLGVTLFIQFQSNVETDNFGFSPVPCDIGFFTVDKLPVRYRNVELGVEGSGNSVRTAFDAEGNAFLDLEL